MKQVPVLTIPDDAKRVLAGNRPEAVIIDEPKPPMHPRIIQAANQQMRSMVFGPRMEPTFRERLHHYSSFRALMSGRH